MDRRSDHPGRLADAGAPVWGSDKPLFSITPAGTLPPTLRACARLTRLTLARGVRLAPIAR
ncbi:hypothetical protein [Pantoea sp. 1.19]|uniref:hypothetical protein n=1 Tax=Pantoea sp. 1.19 TaxID=1925589 RepID=UPI0011150C82|nr:hypothetical protein [Pantoea sp. 1.19]